MSYWIFKTNPAIYPIDKRLLDPDPKEMWKVSRYRNEIKEGDIAFIWRAGIPRGIVAVAKVTSDPYFLKFDPTNHKWTGQYKVNITFIKRIHIIESSFLKQIPGLENMSVFHGYQAIANFRLTDAEGKIIESLIG